MKTDVYSDWRTSLPVDEAEARVFIFFRMGTDECAEIFQLH